MATNYRDYLANQGQLLPSDMREWLPDRQPALHVRNLVDQLDLWAFRALGAGSFPAHQTVRGFRRIAAPEPQSPPGKRRYFIPSDRAGYFNQQGPHTRNSDTALRAQVGILVNSWVLFPE